jgi:hypothetical protein
LHYLAPPSKSSNKYVHYTSQPEHKYLSYLH